MKPIPHADGYYADESGNIYSLRPFQRSKEPRKIPYLVAPQKTPNGYNIVKVRFNGKRKMMSRAYLILLTFVGERPPKHMVCHGVNGKNDDSLQNLCYGTGSKNSKDDRERDGTLLYGEANPTSKLKNEDIREIRKLRLDSVTYKEIADRFNVSQTTISRIIKGETWVRVV